MNLGQFSVSLAVKDIRASRQFYQKLGFEIYDDHEDENWVIMRNDAAVIGLFQGMFDANILTFNPTDARAIQRALKANGLSLDAEADDSTTGPTYLQLTDPNGNTILIDQHAPNYTPTSAQ
jgi:predicted lactoylglutathione lyase